MKYIVILICIITTSIISALEIPVTKVEDFLAIYNKKMLWRANLFIDDKNNKLTDNIYPEEYWTVNYPDADTTQKRIAIVQGWTYWDNTRAPGNDWDNYIDTIFRSDQKFSDNADPNNTKHSSIYAGVDCAGLVQHSLLFGATDWDNAVAFNRANAQGVMARYTAFWYINNPISKSGHVYGI